MYNTETWPRVEIMTGPDGWQEVAVVKEINAAINLRDWYASIEGIKARVRTWVHRAEY